MKKLIFFVLILATACLAKEDAPAPSPKGAPKGFSVDPDAVALLDRAAKLYSECKTIRMRWKTVRLWSPQVAADKPISTAIAFVRPSYSKIEIENGTFPHEIYINDEKASWRLWKEDARLVTYAKSPQEKNKSVRAINLSQFWVLDDELGATIFDFLGGIHRLQPAQVKIMQRPIEQVEYFEAKKSSRASWKGRSWERVRFWQRYDAKISASFNRNLIFWLAIDNARIVKVEVYDDKDKISQIYEVVEQTFNPVISASTFVLKIPRGAKKE